MHMTNNNNKNNSADDDSSCFTSICISLPVILFGLCVWSMRGGEGLCGGQIWDNSSSSVLYKQNVTGVDGGRATNDVNHTTTIQKYNNDNYRKRPTNKLLSTI